MGYKGTLSFSPGRCSSPLTICSIHLQLLDHTQIGITLVKFLLPLHACARSRITLSTILITIAATIVTHLRRRKKISTAYRHRIMHHKFMSRNPVVNLTPRTRPPIQCHLVWISTVSIDYLKSGLLTGFRSGWRQRIGLFIELCV